MAISLAVPAGRRIVPAARGARGTVAAALAAALALAAPPAARADEPAVVAALRAADRDGTVWPPPTQVEPALDLAGAYRVQTAYVRERLAGAAPAGFKGGMMAPAQQARYGLSAPIAGVLYPDGRVGDGDTVPAGRAAGLLVEAEVGWTLARVVTAPVPDAAAMAALVERAWPVLELPRVRFAAPETLNGLDLVASDVAAEFHVVGPALTLSTPADADTLTVVLRRDGAEVARSAAAPPLGGQMEALRWLVNRVLELGWPVGPASVFITGTLTTPAPAAPGHWSAEYGTGGGVAVRIPAPVGD